MGSLDGKNARTTLTSVAAPPPAHLLMVIILSAYRKQTQEQELTCINLYFACLLFLLKSCQQV